MSKLRKLIIATLAVCSAACVSFGLAACDKQTDYPNYKNPSYSVDGNGNANSSNVYTINVTSEGGLKLSNVRIAIKKDGNVIQETISQNGKITIPLDPDEYELEINEKTLPAGYYIPEGKTFTTSKDSRTVDITLPSKIISTVASTDKRYSLGDVMYDFSFTADGVRYTLSNLLQDKLAVVLNFWYSTCSPCRSEFPALEKAYFNYEDKLEVVALDSTDSSATIKAFKEELKLELLMAQDQANITKLFNVSNFPTTVIIDRFGVVAYIDEGAVTDVKNWNALFNKYTSDDYVQSEVDEDDTTVAERVKPTVEMSPTKDIAAAINGEGTSGKMSDYYGETATGDAEYSWNWIVGTDETNNKKYIAASNINVDNSFATIYVDITLNAGDILSYDYNIISQSESDYLYVIIDNNSSSYKVYSGDSEGWQTEEAVYTAKRTETINVAILYNKNGAYSEENERVWISNFTITNASQSTTPTDIYVSAVSGTVGSDGMYEDYQTVKLNPEDGYYHIYNTKTQTYGALLMADILNATAWSDSHAGGKTFVDDSSSSHATSLYLLSFWKMSNQEEVSDDESLSLEFTFDDQNGALSELLIAYYYYQGFSDNDYLPVDEELKNLLVTFTSYYYEHYENDTQYDEDLTWLELCYYGIHYGSNHTTDCTINDDPIKAFSYKNAYEITEGVSTTVNITKILSYNGGGLYYKFVPSASGVYNIYTGVVKDANGKTMSTSDPLVVVKDANLERLYYLDNNDGYNTLSSYANRYHVFAYVYLEAGETYYLQCREAYAQDTGTFSLMVKPVKVDGEIVQSYDYLRVCTTDDGAWDYETLKYSAVDYGFDGDYYYALNDDNTYGSLIYIDFIHPNFYDSSNHTLKEIIDRGYFNFTAYGDSDYTEQMQNYYAQAMANEGELNGMIEASDELVTILAKHFEYIQGEAKSTGYWLSVATYYQHIGK